MGLVPLYAFFICLLFSVLATPTVKKIAIRLGAIDRPDFRKVHTKVMPRLGGLAIFCSFIVGFLLFTPDTENSLALIAGAVLIVTVGVIDDIKQISAKYKMVGQLLAAIMVVLGGIQIEFITLPFGPRIEFGLWAVPITILWIVGVTNAINFIDGLDGLACGVSAIALTTISGMALFMGIIPVALIGLILLGGTLGFLFYNFYPAKIFLGDTGSLFLGYMISVLSILGLFKNVAMFSVVIPIIILGIPIADTFFAILRRIVKKQPLSAPDKFHLHHCLLRLGYSHQRSVLIIYFLCTLFSIAAVIFSRATLWGGISILILLAILIELIVELTGLVSQNYRPMLKIFAESRMRRP